MQVHMCSMAMHNGRKLRIKKVGTPGGDDDDGDDDDDQPHTTIVVEAEVLVALEEAMTVTVIEVIEDPRVAEV